MSCAILGAVLCSLIGAPSEPPVMARTERHRTYRRHRARYYYRRPRRPAAPSPRVIAKSEQLEPRKVRTERILLEPSPNMRVRAVFEDLAFDFLIRMAPPGR